MKSYQFGNRSKAFNSAGNFLGNKAFCDTFTLQEVKDKCTAALCTGSIGAFSTKTEAESSKHPIVEGLILLIEEILEEKFKFLNSRRVNSVKIPLLEYGIGLLSEGPVYVLVSY